MNRRSANHSDNIASAFNRGAKSYDDHAHVQQYAARLLEERIVAFTVHEAISRIVDLGCGTGTFTRALADRFPYAAFVACDIAPAMIAKAEATLTAGTTVEQRRRFSIICTDAERATFTPTPDLITSNFAIQWFSDPLATLAHHARRTRFLAITTLIEGTFATWTAAHELRGMNHGLRSFPNAASIVATCEQLEPARMQCHIDQVDERFPNAIEFLRSLRILGAATARSGHEPTPLQSVLRSFDHGFTAEYRICTILLEMPVK